MSVRKPSDLGYNDDGYDLPALHVALCGLNMTTYQRINLYSQIRRHSRASSCSQGNYGGALSNRCGTSQRQQRAMDCMG